MGSQVSAIRLFIILTILLCVAVPARVCAAASSEETILNDAALAQLEARAQSAQPREQCFLYAELVHNLTEVAGRELANGEDEQAGSTLRHINTLVQKIQTSIARDSKRLKNAELLMRHTTRRLMDMLHVASNDDRPVLQATLKRLDTVQSEMLTQVFVH
ncbi:MAG: hypothetical protein M3R43_10870 [Acidobacteriota bacterium]|nr:hypothetical protein [Acidobacteriota bacterium]